MVDSSPSAVRPPKTNYNGTLWNRRATKYKNVKKCQHRTQRVEKEKMNFDWCMLKHED